MCVGHGKCQHDFPIILAGLQVERVLLGRPDEAAIVSFPKSRHVSELARREVKDANLLRFIIKKCRIPPSRTEIHFWCPAPKAQLRNRLVRSTLEKVKSVTRAPVKNLHQIIGQDIISHLVGHNNAVVLPVCGCRLQSPFWANPYHGQCSFFDPRSARSEFTNIRSRVLDEEVNRAENRVRSQIREKNALEHRSPPDLHPDFSDDSPSIEKLRQTRGREEH